MSNVIRIKCPNVLHCGHVNVFDEAELIGEVPMVDSEGNRVPAPPVEIDENTFVQCEKCRYPINCADAAISDEDVST